MDNRIGVKRMAILAITAVFGVAAVSGFFQRGGWADNVEAIDLQPTQVDTQPMGPGQPPREPARDAVDDETLNRRDDDDEGLDTIDDDEDEGTTTGNTANTANSGDGDGTRGDDGTSGGNNTGGNDSRSRGGTT